MRAAALAVALAFALAACSSEAESFRLHLSWQQGGALACPTGDDGVASCSSIPITCDARVLVRIAPSAEGGVPFYSQCYRITNATDACALGGLSIVPSSPIPNEMVRVQVAVWSDEQLLGKPLADNGCPEDVAFDVTGKPSTQVQDPALVPALGGEIYFPVGDRREALVPLACPRHDWLDLPACLDKPIVRATVREPLSFATVTPAVADQIDVRFGAPRPDGEGAWTLGADLELLVRAAGSSEAVWSNRLVGAAPDPTACAEVLLRETQATLAATCQTTVIADGSLPLTGFVVRKTLVAELLHALELDDVPASGLVLGVVVDHLNRPVAGARVGVTPASEIVYPTATFEPSGLQVTSATGIFLSTAAPFDAGWSAVDPSGVGDDRSARGGLIADHVTVVMIRLNPPIGGG
jgi:hypothetical protein